MKKYFQIISSFSGRAKQFVSAFAKTKNGKVVLSVLALSTIPLLASMFSKLINGSADQSPDLIPAVPPDLSSRSEIDSLSSSKYASRLGAAAQDVASMSSSIENSARLSRINDMFNALSVILAKETDQESIGVMVLGLDKCAAALHFGLLDTNFDVSRSVDVSLAASRETISDIEASLCKVIKLSGEGVNLICPR